MATGRLAKLEQSGPILHRYPDGRVFILFIGTNSRQRKCKRHLALGKLTDEAAQNELEIFKVRYQNGQVPPLVRSKYNKAKVQRASPPPAPLPVRSIHHHNGAPPPRLPRDATKAVLGVVASHLLNTLAHTLKVLQESDETGD